MRFISSAIQSAARSPTCVPGPRPSKKSEERILSRAERSAAVISGIVCGCDGSGGAAMISVGITKTQVDNAAALKPLAITLVANLGIESPGPVSECDERLSRTQSGGKFRPPSFCGQHEQLADHEKLRHNTLSRIGALCPQTHEKLAREP